MNVNNLIQTLQENSFLRNHQEIEVFESTLTKLTQKPDDDYLSNLYLVLNDRCENPEVMFSLIHFLESFDARKQIQEFINVVPQLMINSPEWTKTIHQRILNDELSCKIYQEILHKANSSYPLFIYQLLEESVKNKLAK